MHLTKRVSTCRTRDLRGSSFKINLFGSCTSGIIGGKRIYPQRSNEARAIEILDDEFNLARREVINVPIVGTVTCGEPILAEQNIQGYFPIPPEYLHANGKNTFMLKVKGDSMINAGIFDGDLVMCEEAQTARNAEMVVALIDDSATVKTYYKEAGYYRLQPENDTMDPIIVQDGELQILGKVIGLFRTF